MRRRELLKATAASTIAGLAGTILAPQVYATAKGNSSSEAAKALAELQKTLDDLEASFTTPAWKLRTPEDFAEARRITLHAPFFNALVTDDKTQSTAS